MKFRFGDRVIHNRSKQHGNVTKLESMGSYDFNTKTSKLTNFVHVKFQNGIINIFHENELTSVYSNTKAETEKDKSWTDMWDEGAK